MLLRLVPLLAYDQPPRTTCLMVVVGESDSNTLVGVVEHSVVLAHEHITQDPERSGWGWNIQAHEAQQADRAIRNQVILRGQGVGIAIDLDVNIWLVATAVGQELASVAQLEGADSISDLLDILAWSSDDGGTAVHDSGVDVSNWLALDAHLLHVNLPVSGMSQWNVVELASVEVLVDTTEGELTQVLLRVSKVECEDALVNQSSLTHVLEDSGDLADR